MENNQIKEELHTKIELCKSEDVRLYVVVRQLKPGMKKSSKVLDKYLFKVYGIDSDDNVREYLKESSLREVQKLIDKKFDVVDYDIMDEDKEHLFSYAVSNKIESFSDVVQNQIKEEPKRIKRLSEIDDIEDVELWAYCVEFRNEGDVTNPSVEDEFVYTFRKIQPAKIVVDQRDNSSSWRKMITVKFNTDSAKLELFSGDVMSLEERIDCLYFNGTYYVVQKSTFETMVGFSEQYKDQAKKIVTNYVNLDKIEGLDKLGGMIENKPSLAKKLIRISKIGLLDNLETKVISKMARTAKRHKLTLKTNADKSKIKLEDEDDVEVLIKLAADYFKTGEVSEKSYGSYTGRLLKN